MLQPLFFRWRFAFKLTFAILLALVLGFHFQLQTPRWSVLTAAIVAFGLAGYTALIIIVGIQSFPQMTPQYAVERVSEIVLGIVCVILADILFSPRSIKRDIDRALDKLLIDHYRLLQLCVNNAPKEEVDSA